MPQTRMMNSLVSFLLISAVWTATPAVAFQPPTFSSIVFPSAILRLTTNVPPLRYQNGNEETKGYTSTSVQKKGENHGNDVRGSGAQIPLIKSIVLSQTGLLIGMTSLAVMMLALGGYDMGSLDTLHWSDSADFKSFSNFQMTWTRLLKGTTAAIPMIYLEKHIFDSDRRDATLVNLSTTNTVMTLFGRRRHASKNGICTEDATSMPEVLLLSLLMAFASGVSEEIIFRGFVPVFAAHLSHSIPVALMSQAALFGLGHISPSGSLGENKLVGGLQTMNGLLSGSMYLLTGGDILPCIISHVLYDLHMFMKTWMLTNDQIDYTEEAVMMKLTPEEQEEVIRIKQEGGPSLSIETIGFARRFFFAFDHERQGSLSRSDVQRAMSYAFLQDSEQPTEESVDNLFKQVLKSRKQVLGPEEEQRLQLSEFLRILFVLKARPNPV
mmetsp:Transcript_14078/g.20266  ORF Transcript_14078/g.20266 Transcript_14078/m.20266 type:complete len:439 (-) Transcript_14078:130-1446(-)